MDGGGPRPWAWRLSRPPGHCPDAPRDLCPGVFPRRGGRTDAGAISPRAGALSARTREGAGWSSVGRGGRKVPSAKSPPPIEGQKSTRSPDSAPVALRSHPGRPPPVPSRCRWERGVRRGRRDLAPKGHPPPPPPQGLKLRRGCQVPLGEALPFQASLPRCSPLPQRRPRGCRLLPVEEFLCLRQVRV